MKIITNFKYALDGTKITITGDVVEKPMPKMPAQQVTLMHFSPHDAHFARHVQMIGHGNESALVVRRFNQGLAIDLESWVCNVALPIEPKLAAPPKGSVAKSPTQLKANILTELNPKFQWQIADKHTTESDQWKAIDGAVSDTLNLAPEMKGKWVRCFANTDAGDLATPPVSV